MNDKPWYEVYKDRYKLELEDLQSKGITYLEDADLKIKNGILRLTLEIVSTNPNFQLNEDLLLVAVFPDTYPWFRPQVYAYDLELPRHQHPFGKNLCLIPRPTEFWEPEETLASLLVDQLDLVLTKGREENLEVIKNDPVEQAEPASEYYDYLATVIFNPDNLPVVEPTDELIIVGSMTFRFPQGATLTSRMAISDIKFGNITRSNILSNKLHEEFSGKKIEGPIIQLPKAPPGPDGLIVWDWLRKHLGTKIRHLNKDSKISMPDGRIFNVIALTFPVEVLKGEYGTAWMFLIQGTMQSRDARGKIIDGKRNLLAAYLAQPSFIHSDAMKDRVPKLLPLTNKVVALVGLGALGSFAAIELARAGIKELRLIDYDKVDPPTTVRWPLGHLAAGLLKTEVITNFIEQHYPLTKVTAVKWRISDLRVDGKRSNPIPEKSEQTIIYELLSGVDLLIDATAEKGINNFLSYTSNRCSLNYISMYATPGAYGGVIMRYIPGETGCWSCMKQWLKDDPTLLPPSDVKGEVQPPGCGDVTFTGSGFDLQNISLAAIRLAICTLCRGEEGGYPDVNWDWGVLRLVDENELPISPQWTTSKLDKHPNCPYNAIH